MVRKHWLVVMNAAVWMAAGVNIARIGIASAIKTGTLVWLWSVVVFAAFFTMFHRVIGKNTRRIASITKEIEPICMFLTIKGYIIITFMMTMGIVLRQSCSIPEGFFAFFYSGLGCALFLAGALSLLSSDFRRLRKEDRKH